MFYVVGTPQTLHFQQLRRLLAESGTCAHGCIDIGGSNKPSFLFQIQLFQITYTFVGVCLVSYAVQGMNRWQQRHHTSTLALSLG